MLEQEVYIDQRDSEKDLYVHLQHKAIETIQHLCGKIWTDYNAHDPGVTLIDILNYALTELGFKLGFPLEDYLTEKEKGFHPEDFGFFLPDKVFPTTPVTIDDYRKLFLMHVPELENVWIDIDKATGSYDIHLEIFHFMGDVIREGIEKKVRQLFQANRNLCESVRKVDFVTLEKVQLSAEINIESGIDATRILVEIFQKTYAYLAKHVHYQTPDERVGNQISPDEWLDGPNESEIRISTVPNEQVGTESELYHQLRKINGIKSIYSCYIKDKNEQIINRFESPYALFIPSSWNELNTRIQIKIEGMPAMIHFDRFVSEFNTTNWAAGNYLRIQTGERFSTDYPSGNYHPIYSHDTVLNDFPTHYGINEKGLSGFVPDERKAQAKQLKAYLYLFDFIFSRGLMELQEMPRWMKLDNQSQIKILSPEQLDRLKEEELFMPTDKTLESFCSKQIVKQKSRLLDMLDALYGEDSNPTWLNEYNYYDDTEETRIEQRIRFLKKVPLWGKNRFKACDLSGEQNEINIPGIKAYVCTLLNWSCDEGKAVGNIFPAYNLNFISEKEYENQLSRMLKSDLIQEQMLNQYNMESIPEASELFEEKDYEEMRFTLPYFHNNLLNEELFRGGINLENFKIVHVGGSEFLLAFKNQKKKVWMSLGRSANKEKLYRMAHILRHFLLKLNRESETMYVVEHLYFKHPEPFVLTIILSNWSARMATPRFQEICRMFIQSRLPAHIQVHFCWLNIDDLQRFEVTWRKWRRCMQTGNQGDATETMEVIENILESCKKTTI